MSAKRWEAISGKCKAQTNAAGPCAAPAMKGSQLCPLHSTSRRCVVIPESTAMSIPPLPKTRALEISVADASRSPAA